MRRSNRRSSRSGEPWDRSANPVAETAGLLGPRRRASHNPGGLLVLELLAVDRGGDCRDSCGATRRGFAKAQAPLRPEDIAARTSVKGRGADPPAPGPPRRRDGPDSEPRRHLRRPPAELLRHARDEADQALELRSFTPSSPSSDRLPIHNRLSPTAVPAESTPIGATTGGGAANEFPWHSQDRGGKSDNRLCPHGANLARCKFALLLQCPFGFFSPNKSDNRLCSRSGNFIHRKSALLL